LRVDVHQLIPGTVLLEDVIGKSGKPIVPKQMTLTAQHIDVLKKFLIEKVDVATQLADGTPFITK